MDPCDRIGRWRVKAPEGTGRVGRTFVVFPEEAPERTYVLKLQRDDLPACEGDVVRAEAERLSEATGKVPHRLPELIGSGTHQGRSYFVMERLEGIDYPIPEADYRSFCVKAFLALDDLHRAGLLHCDLTPLHLRWKNGDIAFIDLDSSHTLFESLRNRNGVGTDPYIAPEVASQGRVSIQADIYSLATILLEHCPKRQLDCFRPTLDECLSPDERKRPPTAALVAERLRTCRAPHHRFKAVAKWSSFALAIVAVSVACLALTSKLYWRSEQTNAQYAVTRAEAESNAGKRYFKAQQYGLAVKHLESALRTPGFADREVYEILSRCYGEGLGVDMDPKKSHDYAQLSKGLQTCP